MTTGCETIAENYSCHPTPYKDITAGYGSHEALQHVQTMMEQMSRGKYEEAIQTTNKALDLADITPKALGFFYKTQSQAFLALDRREEGIDSLEKSLNGDHQHPMEATYLRTKLEMLKSGGEAGDVYAQPIVRIPAMMPPRAERSGHCQLKFDIGNTGSPNNIEIIYCTEALFEKPSLKSVKLWKYSVKMEDGKPSNARGVESKVSYQLLDACGNIIPEKQS